MLELKQVSLAQEQRLLMRGLDLTFQPGEFWAIIGANGVGKSTLLHTLAGLIQPAAGSVLFNGNNLQHMSIAQRAQSFSLLLQDQEPTLAFSVREAVGMGRFPWRTQRSEDAQITTAAMAQARITALADQSILKLSGGERRKVEIATCLAQQAEYLLMDEPLNHLDLVYRQHILNEFSEISQNRCVIMVCHDLDAVKKHCTHVLMLLPNHCYLAGSSATILTTEHINQLFHDHSQ